MITDKGKSLITAYLASTFTKANVGSGGNSTSPSQLELDVPLLSTPKTSGASVSDENVVDFSVTILGTDASIVGETLREICIEDASGNLLLRIPFDAIGPFSESEEVEFFIAVEVETRYDNCGILTKMGDNSTHNGARKPPIDGQDFPHTGLIKLFDAQRYGYVILSKDVTTGSSSSTAGSVFDCNFNIGMDDTTSSGNTTISVMSGAVIRDGILVNVSTGASVGVGVKITEVATVATDGTHGNDTDGFTKFAEQGTSGQNFYHVIVVNHANNIRIRNPSAQDKVAELGAGDTNGSKW